MKMLKYVCQFAIVGSLLLSSASQATVYGTGAFAITHVEYAAAANMHVRVFGMSPMSYCNGSDSFAFVDEADSGAKAKIAALIAAQASGQAVSLAVEPIDKYGNGQLFCRIVGFTVIS